MKINKRQTIRYIIISLISLGILCSPFSIFTIVYDCKGQDVFPVYFGSPFIFKSTSLATSLAYDYYLTGFIADWIIWSLIVVLISYLFDSLKWTKQRFVLIFYRFIVGSLIAVSILCVISVFSIGDNDMRFKANLNKEAKTWGMDCKGRFRLID
ncbi:MAG TPA: hypothetical protein VHO72_07785 [Bacteroidales bacterium]|nr:hypothetical protein [Bacteroidales bacterium]